MADRPHAHAPKPIFIVIESDKECPGSVQVYGPFANQNEAIRARREWTERGGDEWEYKVRTLTDPTDWGAGG